MPSTQYPTTEEYNVDTMSQSDDGEKGHNYSQIYYPSNVIGASVRNAVSGSEYPCKRGDAAQLQYFQVIDARGLVDNNGRKRRLGVENDNGRDPNYLYYNSPEEYMQHCRDQSGMRRIMTITPEHIEAWEDKQRLLFPRERNFVNNGGTVFQTGDLNRKEFDNYTAQKKRVNIESIVAERENLTTLNRVTQSYHQKGCPYKLGFGGPTDNPGPDIPCVCAGMK
jgi:hypothetical protein